MRLLKYSFRDHSDDGWNFSTIDLRKVNLFVGATGSGKSRLLNSLFNMATFIHQGVMFRDGFVEIEFRIESKTYRWQYEGLTEAGKSEVQMENLLTIGDDGEETFIYKRNSEHFLFNGVPLPKLSKTTSAIFLLKEEELIAPIHAEFSKILRRNFFGPELQEACSISNLPAEIVTESKKKKNDGIAQMLLTMPLGPRLYLLRENSREQFDALVDQYRAVFPTVENIDFTEGAGLMAASARGKVPILTIKERLIKHPVMLHEMSSGMQKVLLILADVMTMPTESVYIIDEYENSLGINAINFLPSFLNEFGGESQFIVISHHPYLINNMPLANWHVFHRTGSSVLVESGEGLSKKYGKSKQEAFIQLINDPIFLGERS